MDLQYITVFSLLSNVHVYTCNLCVTQVTHSGILLKGFIHMSLNIHWILWFSVEIS